MGSAYSPHRTDSGTLDAPRKRFRVCQNLTSCVLKPHNMNNAFYVVPVGGGDHVFASNILSECMEIARYFTRVEIVDMFGEVWRAADSGDRRSVVDPRANIPAKLLMCTLPASNQSQFQALSKTSI